MNVETIQILTGFAIIQAILAGLIVILGRLWLNRRLNEAKTNVAAFFAPKNDGPSDFAAIVGTIGDDLSGRIVSHAKATFMGIQSGAARQEKAIAGAISQDLVTMESPIAGAILQSFPAVRKLVNKNPELAAMLPGILDKFTKGTAAPAGNNGNGSNSSIKFGKF